MAFLRTALLIPTPYLQRTRLPTINVLLLARDLRWVWLGHILRMDERRTVCQVLLNCVKPQPESNFGDLIDLDVNEAISLTKDWIEWKRIGPRNVAGPLGE